LYVGSIEKRKGIIYLINALSNISYDFSLDIIGVVKSPNYFQMIKEKIAELGLEKNITFRGRVSAEDLVKFYINSSIFVFPTLYEGYGMAVAEAMAYGLPVISTRIPAIEEYLEDGKQGYLVAPCNAEQFAEKLDDLMNNSDLFELFSQNAIFKAKSFPSWEASSEKIWHIIRRDFNLP
jgi:glycosyltransferase involved in cell wall biosynthesis